MRNYLLDITKFDKLLGRLLSMAQDSSVSEDIRVASLLCIMNFLKNNSQDKNYPQFLKLFAEHSDIKSLLSDTFLDRSVTYQQTVLAFLDKVNLLKQSSDFMFDFLMNSQLNSLFAHSRAIPQVKNTLDLV